MIADVLVIGAGPAGIMAAITAVKSGAKVILVERNQNIGKKLSITGAGRCNITNQTDIEEFIRNIPGNGRFLYSVLQNFSPNDLIDFFGKELQVPLKVERGRRVFPDTDQAWDIVNALTRELKKVGVKLITETRVTQIKVDDGTQVAGITCENGRMMEAKSAVIATGGLSYPGTGSTGDGYRLVQAVGHTIIDPLPSLVPLESVEDWPKQLQGLSLVNVLVTSFAHGEKLEAEFGEMLFTHFGVSGPVILSLSRTIVPKILKEPGSVTIIIDLKPALSEMELDLRVQRDFGKYSRKIYQNSLDDLLPQKLIPVIIELSAIDHLKPVHQITREERLKLVKLLKNLSLKIARPRPIAEAIITMGGVNTKEINPKTMESKQVSGLYFAGEVIDVDGYTGGYNLQIAFSTGYAAGRAAAQRRLEAQ
jgi:predicted Rossmann fold flavoprotein